MPSRRWEAAGLVAGLSAMRRIWLPSFEGVGDVVETSPHRPLHRIRGKEGCRETSGVELGTARARAEAGGQRSRYRERRPCGSELKMHSRKTRNYSSWLC